MFSVTRQQVRLHSTFISKATQSKFPSLSEVTAKETGFASEQPQFGHNNTYSLQRSIHNKLPIYTEYKQGRTPYTEIRKIQGDIIQLRNDLQEALPEVKKENFKVVMESKKILIKGNYKRQLHSMLNGVF